MYPELFNLFVKQQDNLRFRATTTSDAVLTDVLKSPNLFVKQQNNLCFRATTTSDAVLTDVLKSPKIHF